MTGRSPLRRRSIPKDQEVAELTRELDRFVVLRGLAGRARQLGHEIDRWLRHDQENIASCTRCPALFHEGTRGARFHHAPNGRVSGPVPDRSSYGSFASFSDPDVNGWLLQEVTTRLPGRIDPAATSFASANDLASALRRAAAAHGEYEQRTGQADPNWPDWYAEYMVAAQAGKELPS